MYLHSFILSNFSKTEAIAKICEIAGISLMHDRFDQHPDIYQIYPQINTKTVVQKPSIKIEQVRQFQLEFNKKPLQLPAQIAVLWQAESLSLVAANALLKILEEPTEQSFIFLIVNSYHHLLPTIQSRCQIVTPNIASQSFQTDLVTIDLKTLYQIDIGERMELIAKACPTQKDALIWLKSLIICGQKKLPQSSIKGMGSLAKLLENAQLIYNDISVSNVNWKLCLDMLAMKWDSEIISF